MRLLPPRYDAKQPVTVKRERAKVKHLQAPLKGLSLSSKLVEGDPLKAPILDNWIIEENQIRCRPGTSRVISYASPTPISCFIPYHSGVNRLAAAINHELRLLDDTLVKGGFTSDDWHWTGFSNLASREYTILVNGKDGVWSWDGDTTSTTPGAVAVTSLSNSNPAVITVASADISKFVNGTVVVVAGATGTGMTTANGPHLITGVNASPNTFKLIDANTSSGTAPQTTGVTVVPAGTGIVKEAVTAPAGESWIDPNQFDIVVAHMNRLWFADKTNLALYYLPLQQKSGEVSYFPLNAVFRRGGHIKAVYTWTVEGGAGMDDQLCIFSSNGECVIYSGTDPDTPDAFSLAGIFRFDSPMSKHCVANYGGELFVLVSSGLVPMSTLMKAESEQLGQYEKDVFSSFYEHSLNHRNSAGWQVMLNQTSGRMFCNLPAGGPNNYHQMVRAMPNPVWSSWSGLPARCMGWISNRVYIGSDTGKVYEVHPNFLGDTHPDTDQPVPIQIDLQMAWSSYGTPAIKHFKMVLPYIITDGAVKPFIDMRVDYDISPPKNQPEPSVAGALGSDWDTAEWATSVGAPPDTYWTSVKNNRNNYTGVGVLGHQGAVRLTASILGSGFALSGFDIIYEPGSVFG